ncbi:TRAP transporter substrate-binding protein [Aquibium carbonis]|uniref:TRAP transporter substrate-binding protein n=1 Tax=Aquibium carbonis TaxID=2495581 RepID=A0A3R9YDD9_9HYPH|nr:TRAP transporter substrate-binding protein [Aquibium carbonis]RST85029.1 TRAP transporter substrate-binding protein [Aquibium carbonis]
MGIRHLVISAAALWASTGGAVAQEVNMRLGHWVPPTHPIHTMVIEPWAESIKEASGGRINITIFPAGQLGAPADHYDMTRDGVTDIAYVAPGYQAGRFPVYALHEVPFFVTNATDGAMAVHEWYAPYAEKEMADVKFCVANPPDPATIHSKNPVRLPGDLRGINIRAANATISRFVSSLGAGPVQVPASEAREAVTKGLVDAVTFPWNSVFIFGIDSVLKNHLDMPIYTGANFLLFNKATYANLPDDLKKVIDDHCTPEWSKRVSSGWAENEQSGRQKAIDAGHTLHAPSPEEVQAWRDAAAPLLDKWREDATAAGWNPDEVLASYREALKRHDSLYEAE